MLFWKKMVKKFDAFSALMALRLSGLRFTLICRPDKAQAPHPAAEKNVLPFHLRSPHALNTLTHRRSHAKR